MITITSRDKISLTRKLEEALIRFSDNKVSKMLAAEIAQSTIETVDLNNPTFSHKGINWLAKEILKKMN